MNRRLKVVSQTQLSNTDGFCELLTLIATVSQQHTGVTGQWAQAALKTSPFHFDKNHLTWTNYMEQNRDIYGRNCRMQHSITKIKENSVFCRMGGNKLGVCEESDMWGHFIMWPDEHRKAERQICHRCAHQHAALRSGQITCKPWEWV